ncbi:hypothetical protein, conserved [Plasmodium gonderi]|uniref:RecF/RecN/SMC N-terminal domain-containing protein n=1 Tax=Plasmodium gonderi TaxID=77519 RepID=A0A1Y1JIW4_PLAGO|nr:hypothetical protein, conserved [Plasmodium gonderi]GAW81305.1 hypothetical protein, conserved [Plasmodium gonderi]
MEKINECMKEEKERQVQLQTEINKRENHIYEMEYIINKNNNTLEEINKKINAIKIHSNKIQKIKNTKIKRKIYTYGYDIYSFRNNIMKNYRIINSSDEPGFSFSSSILDPGSLDTNGKNSVLISKERVESIPLKEKNPDFVFKYEPIGPVGEYIKPKENTINEKILSIIEKHLGDIFFAWLVSCYEDKNKLSSMEIENKNRINIIVTNAFQHINRKTLLQNIHSIMNKINGNTIYSFLNIDLLPTSLLFYLYDNFKIVQTLVCNNSTELHELLRKNDKKIIKSIYVVEEFVVVKVLPNGGLHYQPFKEDYYEKPTFLNINNEEGSLYKSNGNEQPDANMVKNMDSSNPSASTSLFISHEPNKEDSENVEFKNNEDHLKELEKRKTEKNEEIIMMSKKLLTYRNILESLNESLKKCQYTQDELKYKHKNIEELIQNHDNIFSEQLDLEIREKNKDIIEMNEYVDEIDQYMHTLNEKKKRTLDTCSIHKWLISTHGQYLKRKKEKFALLIEQYNNLCEVLLKLEKDKLKNDEIAFKNKKNFLVAINKLHSVYFEYLTNGFSLLHVLLENPFLVLRGRSSNVLITNVIIERCVENQTENKSSHGSSYDENDNVQNRMENDQIEKTQSKESEFLHQKKNDKSGEETTIRVTFTVENPSNNIMGVEEICIQVPFSSLSYFNKFFVLSKKDENVVDSDEECSYKLAVNSCNKKKESEIKVLRNLEKHIKSILNLGTNISSGSLSDGKVDRLFCNEGANNEDANNEDANNEDANNVDANNEVDKGIGARVVEMNEQKIETIDENCSDILWKKRCEKKKEIIEILKISGFIDKDNTDNSIKAYFYNLIEQYANEEKSYNAQMKQIMDLKNNYDMHLANIKLRKSKFFHVLKKTKEKITVHFKNMLKNMNNYKGKIEFDDVNRNLKVMVSVNQDLSNNIFMEINSLSGGERSTIQMALLASLSLTETSSFHIFDELDVYMDELTRVKNMQRFCEFIEQNNSKQYFFITPHIEITELFLGDAKEKKAKILNLS